MNRRGFLAQRTRLGALVVLGVWAAALLAACGGGGDDALTVYSGRSETLVQPVIDQFTQATGIAVKVKYGGTAGLAATLLEEGDRTPADVFYAQDPGGLGSVEPLLGALDSATLAQIPEWARSPSDLWVGVSGRARVLVYNSNRVSEDELPRTLEELTDPKWRGRVGWAPSNGSFLTMATGMRAIWGEERTRNWVEGMVANAVAVYPKNSPQVAAVGAGEIDIGLVNHYYLYRFLAEEGEDFAARNYHLPGGGPGSLVMVSGVGILDASDNKERARQFVDFLLSQVAQQYFASQTYEYPLVEGVVVNRLLTPLKEIEQPQIRLADLSDLAGTQDLLRAAGALP